VVLHDYALYKSTFTLLYLLLYVYHRLTHSVPYGRSAEKPYPPTCQSGILVAVTMCQSSHQGPVPSSSADGV